MSAVTLGQNTVKRCRSRLVTMLLLSTCCMFAGCSDKKYTALGQPDVWDSAGIQDFELTERSGRKITKQDLLGKPCLCTFIFTSCVSACPHVVRAMHDIQIAHPDLDIRLVSFTVDPDTDTVEVLKDFGERNSMDPERWWFLTGNKGTIYRLIHESFKTISMEVVQPTAPDELPKPGNTDVIHSAYIIYVDENGKVQGK